MILMYKIYHSVHKYHKLKEIYEIFMFTLVQRYVINKTCLPIIFWGKEGERLVSLLLFHSLYITTDVFILNKKIFKKVYLCMFAFDFYPNFVRRLVLFRGNGFSSIICCSNFNTFFN